MKTRYEKILEHHGIKGMHWGIRRFQNKDGSLTPKGQKRYGDEADTGISKGLPGSVKHKKIKNSEQASAVRKLGEESANNVDAAARKEFVDAYWDMLNKDPEHYYPDDFEFDEPEPGGGNYNETWDQYKARTSTKEWKDWSSRRDAAYEKYVEPYRKESEAAEQKYIDTLKSLSNKHLGVSVNDRGVGDSYYDQCLLDGFRNQLEELVYQDSLRHSQYVVTGRMFVDEIIT